MQLNPDSANQFNRSQLDAENNSEQSALAEKQSRQQLLDIFREFIASRKPIAALRQDSRVFTLLLLLNFPEPGFETELQISEHWWLRYKGFFANPRSKKLLYPFVEFRNDRNSSDKIEPDNETMSLPEILVDKIINKTDMRVEELVAFVKSVISSRELIADEVPAIAVAPGNLPSIDQLRYILFDLEHTKKYRLKQQQE